MMPHLPGPPGTLYTNVQKLAVRWFLGWDDRYGYKSMWHTFYDEEVSDTYDGIHVLINHSRSNGSITAVYETCCTLRLETPALLDFSASKKHTKRKGTGHGGLYNPAVLQSQLSLIPSRR